MTERPQPSIRRLVAKSRVPAVLQVLPALEVGGAERAAVDIAGALVAAGWRAIVASSGGRMVRDLERAGGRHVALPLASKNPFTIRRNAHRIADLVAAEAIDLVHARSRGPAWSAWLATRTTACRFVTTVHGAYAQNAPFKDRYNAVMARGDRVIAVSEFIAEYVRTHYGVGADRLRVVPRGIDLGLYDPAKVSPERMISLARRWGLPDGAAVALLPGRLTRLKGQGVLIDAMARLARDDCFALLVGAGAGHGRYRRDLERRIRAAGVAGRVRLIDDCTDMPAAYMLADVVVSASIRPEGFGRIAAEAQAMGRPVIATDHGGAREIVVPGETGWLTPPGDVAALAIALEQGLSLATDARLGMAERARARIARLFTKPAMCGATLAVYAELLGIDVEDPSRRLAAGQ